MKLGHYIAFFVGAAVGAAVMYKHSEQKWREISDEKIDAIKKQHKKGDKKKKAKDPEPDPVPEEKPADTEVKSSIEAGEAKDDEWTKKYVKYVDIVKENNYDKNASYTPKSGSIVSMDEEEYEKLKQSDPGEWTDQTLYYYAKDGVVTDAEYDPVSDYRSILGYQFDNFDEDGISYVRNNDTKEIFIIHYRNLRFDSSMDLSDDDG